MTKKTNILLVVTDDQGIGDVGCHGNPVLKTPALDAFGSSGVRLNNFHVGPTCAPTRAGLLTGRYHNCTGVWHTIMGRSLLRWDEVTLAEILQKGGYATGLFGKWHLGDNFPMRPQDNGFDEVVCHYGGGIGQTPDYWGNDYFDDTYFERGKPKVFEGYCTDVWFRLATDFMSRHRKEPFFCYLATNAPHSPFNVTDSYAGVYRGRVPEERARFYGMIANIDENFAHLMEFLEVEGLSEDTIIIFMGDNGTSAGASVDEETHFVTDGYNAGFRGVKSSEYEGGHRVPFFIRWERGGWTGGRDVKTLTANIDLMPTILEACGLPPSTGNPIHGRDIGALLREGDDIPWPDRVITTDSQRVENPIKWKQSAVMTQRWRLINGMELYDIQSDPGQKNDLAETESETVALLREEYEKWWETVSSRFGEYVRIVIDPDQETETTLTCHDWHGDSPPWNQHLVREGLLGNGFWALEAAQSGKYCFEIRRWPREMNRPIREGLAGEVTWYSGGKALPLLKAFIEVGGHRLEKSIGPGDVGVVFDLDLKPGPFELRTTFEGEDGVQLGAYYVYVRKR